MAASQAPTRAAILELKEEQQVVNEAYVFLDEKRLLLASELLTQLQRYQQLNQQSNELQTRAREAMIAAIGHHGLDGLQVYAAGSVALGIVAVWFGLSLAMRGRSAA